MRSLVLYSTYLFLNSMLVGGLDEKGSVRMVLWMNVSDVVVWTGVNIYRLIQCGYQGGGPGPFYVNLACWINVLN